MSRIFTEISVMRGFLTQLAYICLIIHPFNGKSMKILPLGSQSLSEIYDNNAIYVDKTEYVHRLVTTGKSYFLSRPRRFGKSLLVSTFQELFEANKILFQGSNAYAYLYF